VPLRFFLLLLLTISLSACAGGPRPLQGDQLAVLPITELPPPGPDAAQARAYRVGGYDTLVIDVFGVEELHAQEIRADANGRVSFPFAGTIDAGGMTLDQLSAEIENRLRGRFILNPRVSINVKEMVSQAVTVNGQVKEPGIYPMLNRMTLIRAIARAQGVTEFAAREVVIFRTVGDQHMAALYNLGAIQAGQYADPELFAGDIVVVGDSPTRRLFRDILQILPVAVTPVVALIQRN
jgi:polysaccharide export outer membrane protein